MLICENGKLRKATDEEVANAEKEKQAAEQRQKEEYQKIPYEERVEMLIRERYSLSDELAINRQRDTKPEEFAEFFAYCEDCKLRAKASIRERWPDE